MPSVSHGVVLYCDWLSSVTYTSHILYGAHWLVSGPVAQWLISQLLKGVMRLFLPLSKWPGVGYVGIRSMAYGLNDSS